MKKLKTSRAITYRRYGIPALILEGKWLTDKYRLRIGDVVDIEYLPKEIRFRKNSLRSKERQNHLLEKAELRRRRFYENHDNQERNQIAALGEGNEHSG
jgi:hypothetical protein